MFETDLCRLFIEYMRVFGWIAYPEQGRWDILFVRKNIQFGVQAKLRPTTKLLAQALSTKTVPHYMGLLVYEKTRLKTDFVVVATACKLLIFTYLERSKKFYGLYNKSVQPRKFAIRQHIDWRYYNQRPKTRIWTPPFVPDIEAGASSPKKVSPFMLAAIDLENLALQAGHISRTDAKTVRIKYSGRWRDSTLLNQFFVNAGRNIWKLASSPSKQWPWAVLKT